MMKNLQMTTYSTLLKAMLKVHMPSIVILQGSHLPMPMTIKLKKMSFFFLPTKQATKQ